MDDNLINFTVHKEFGKTEVYSHTIYEEQSRSIITLQVIPKVREDREVNESYRSFSRDLITF